MCLLGAKWLNWISSVQRMHALCMLVKSLTWCYSCLQFHISMRASVCEFVRACVLELRVS